MCKGAIPYQDGEFPSAVMWLAYVRDELKQGYPVERLFHSLGSANWLEIRPVSMGPPLGDVEHVPRAKDNWDPKMPLHILPGAVVRVNLAVFAYLPDLAKGWEIQTSPGKDKNNHSAYAQGMRAL